MSFPFFPQKSETAWSRFSGHRLHDGDLNKFPLAAAPADFEGIFDELKIHELLTDGIACGGAERAGLEPAKRKAAKK